jgi:hypothetical protein
MAVPNKYDSERCVELSEELLLKAHEQHEWKADGVVNIK